MADSILTIWKQNLVGDMGSTILVWLLLFILAYVIIKYGRKR